MTYLQFENIYKRLGSFKQWPVDLTMRPEELAEAGLYHSPSDDNADRVITKIAMKSVKGDF